MSILLLFVRMVNQMFITPPTAVGRGHRVFELSVPLSVRPTSSVRPLTSIPHDAMSALVDEFQ